MLLTFHCTILLSGYKKNPSCSRGLSCHGLTCTCVRAIWEFPSPMRTSSSWPCYLEWMTCVWFPGRQAGACKDMTNIYRVQPLCKARPPLTNLQHADWTLNERRRNSHQLARVMCLLTSSEKLKRNSCLAGWMGPPTTAQSSAPCLFIDVSDAMVAYESDHQDRV